MVTLWPFLVNVNAHLECCDWFHELLLQAHYRWKEDTQGEMLRNEAKKSVDEFYDVKSANLENSTDWNQ